MAVLWSLPPTGNKKIVKAFLCCHCGMAVSDWNIDSLETLTATVNHLCPRYNTRISMIHILTYSLEDLEGGEDQWRMNQRENRFT